MKYFELNKSGYPAFVFFLSVIFDLIPSTQIFDICFDSEVTNTSTFLVCYFAFTAYGLDGPGIESRWGARFSAPFQTGPQTHPASCKMGTESFPGVRCGRGVTLTPNLLLVPRSKRE